MKIWVENSRHGKKNVISKYCMDHHVLNRSKAAPTRASNLCKLVCTNCLTTAPDGTSMWRKPSGCSSYGVNFFNSFLEHALIELFFFILHISFRRLDTFPCICSVI